MKSSGAKVKWCDVCSPKMEGRLGFKVLKDWKRAAMSKHLWAVSQKADTLWVKWVHTYVIERQNLWFMPTPVNSSWTIKKIFKLRPLYSLGSSTGLEMGLPPFCG